LDIALVLDLSGSIEDESNIPLVINLTRALVADFDIKNDNVRVGIVTYSTDVQNIIYMNQYEGNPQALLEALTFNIQPGGYTNTQAALSAMRLNVIGAGKNITRLIVTGSSSLLIRPVDSYYTDFSFGLFWRSKNF